jgi:hypothetical protein
MQQALPIDPKSGMHFPSEFILWQQIVWGWKR